MLSSLYVHACVSLNRWSSTKFSITSHYCWFHRYHSLSNFQIKPCIANMTYRWTLTRESGTNSNQAKTFSVAYFITTGIPLQRLGPLVRKFRKEWYLPKQFSFAKTICNCLLEGFISCHGVAAKIIMMSTNQVKYDWLCSLLLIYNHVLFF